jgi:hypothetical protein
MEVCERNGANRHSEALKTEPKHGLKIKLALGGVAVSCVCVRAAVCM